MLFNFIISRLFDVEAPRPEAHRAELTAAWELEYELPSVSQSTSLFVANNYDIVTSNWGSNFNLLYVINTVCRWVM